MIDKDSKTMRFEDAKEEEQKQICFKEELFEK